MHIQSCIDKISLDYFNEPWFFVNSCRETIVIVHQNFIYFAQEASERLTLFTADEEVFAFQRTISRLTEMQTEQYWLSGDRSQT